MKTTSGKKVVQKLSQDLILKMYQDKNINVLFAQSVFCCRYWSIASRSLPNYSENSCHVKLFDDIYICECFGPMPQNLRRRSR